MKRIFTKFRQGTGCWEWRAAKSSNGYGLVWFKGKTRLAHRVVYELLKGELSEELEIDHLCRNKLCVNPDHLEQVTHKVNNFRGIGITAKNSKKIMCLNGHSLTGSNLRTRIRGNNKERVCKECSYQRLIKFRLSQGAF